MAQKVNANDINLGAAVSTIIATDESTASTSYVDLATTTDSVTVTIGSNGLALVSLFAALYTNTGTGHAKVSVALSGANTVAASDSNAMDYQSASGVTSTVQQYSSTFLMTGLSPGSTTFKMKYAAAVAGTMHAFNRKITVVPL